jgi:hypothetical protein
VFRCARTQGAHSVAAHASRSMILMSAESPAGPYILTMPSSLSMPMSCEREGGGGEGLESAGQRGAEGRAVRRGQVGWVRGARGPCVEG